MSDQVRGVIFVLLVVAITFIWLRFFKPPLPPPPNSPSAITQTAPAQSSGAGPSQAVVAAAPATPVTVPAVQAAAEKIVSVASPLYRIDFSNRGGVARSWTLEKYFDDQTPPHPLDLVNADAAKELGWPLSLTLSDKQLESEANAGLYQVAIEYPSAAAGEKVPVAPANSIQFNAPVTLTFHWSDGHLDVTKKLNFTTDYQLSIEVSAALDGRPLASAIAWQGGFGDRAISKASTLVNVYYEQNNSLSLMQYKKLGVSGNQVQPFQQPGSFEFAGLEDQFFTAAFMPDGQDLTLWHWTQWHHYIANDQPASEPEAEIAVGSTNPGPVKLRAFIGPKDLGLLRQVKPSLEGLVNFGWFGIIAKGLLFALQWLHRYIPNWGWTIIVLTLVINFALFPLKMKSWRSMQELQKVAPEQRQIQDRYKKYSMTDPRRKKQQEEIAELYQRHGISPMTQVGGCLPMILQMPIWFSLWRVLTGAIELRHAPWIFWIHDLSVRDPYYILPISMAISMYLMTKMTPQSAAVDPAQQKMLALMPLAMAAIFFTYASGLTLYMSTSNLVGMGQQWYLNRTRPLPTQSKFKNKKKKE
jgi:YidC/Oxa1 family membrane protein insertase